MLLKKAFGKAEGLLAERRLLGIDLGDVGDPLDRVGEIVELGGNLLTPTKAVPKWRIAPDAPDIVLQTLGEQAIQMVGNPGSGLDELAVDDDEDVEMNVAAAGKIDSAVCDNRLYNRCV